MKGWDIEVYKGRGSQPWRWRLKGRNHKILATAGEGFSSRAALINNIVRVQIGIGLATIKDLTKKTDR